MTYCDNFSTRTKNALKNNGITDLELLRNFTRKEFKQLRGIGAGAYEEVLYAMKKHKIKFKKEEREVFKHAPIAKKFVQEACYTEEWGKNMKAFQRLFKKFPDPSFWETYKHPYKVKYISYLFYESNFKKIESAWFKFKNKKHAPAKQEPLPELGKEKVGEDVVFEKPLTLEDFLGI